MRKKNCFTKALAVFLTALMLLSVAPLAAMSDVLPKLDLDFDFAVTAHAEGSTPYLTSGYCGDTSDGKDGKDIAWSLDADGTLTLTGTGKMGSTPNRADNRVKKVVVGEGITEIADYAFAGCNKNLEVILPSTIDIIGKNAFYQNDLLAQVDFGGVRVIGEYAFANCVKLTELNFPNTLTEIGHHSFRGILSSYGDSEIESLNIPGSVKIIGDHAFEGQIHLKYLVLNEGLEEIGAFAFSYEKLDARYLNELSEIIIPNSVKVIGASAFYRSTNLQSLTLGQGIQSIGAKAFADCKLLEGNLVLPDSCESVGLDAFASTGFSALQLGKGTTSFARQHDMDNLTQISVPEDNESYTVYDNVLYTKDFSKFIFPAHQTSINLPDALKQQPVFSVTVYRRTISSYNFLTEYNYIENINIGEANPYYRSDNGILYTKNNKQLLICPMSHSGDVDILEGCETIYAAAFYQCKHLNRIHFSSTVKTISWYSFLQSSLTEISFNEGLISIGELAFFNNNHFTDIHFPDSLKQINDNAFEACYGLTSVIFGENLESINASAFLRCSNLTSVSFGNSLLSIGGQAFAQTALSGDLIIPDSCVQIGGSAFSNTSIERLYIGKSLRTFGQNSYMDCLEGVVVSNENVNFSSFDGVLYDKDYSTIILVPQRDVLNLPPTFQQNAYTSISSFHFIKTITIPDESEFYQSIDGLLYSKDGKTLYCCPHGRENDVFVAEGTEQIASSAFSRCVNLSSVTLPEGLKRIGSFSFASPQGTLFDAPPLDELEIPSSVEIIDHGAFNSGKIKKMILHEGLKEIGPYAFLRAEITEINLPNSLETIRFGAFTSSKIKSVVIGRELKDLESNAFSDVYSLEDVTINSCKLKIINQGVFSSTQSMKTLILPEGLQLMGMERWQNISNITVNGKYTRFTNYDSVTPKNRNSVITGYCGSPAHEMAIKRLFKWNSLGHTWLNWYVAEPANFDHDGLEKRDCAYCGESETRVIPKLEQETFTATFVADGKIVASVDFQKGTTAIDEPAVPARDRYTGKWEDYTLNDADLTINAVYSLIKSDDAKEIETDSTIEHYTEKDNILFRVKATSAAKIVKSVVSQSIPLDIVLVVDQSGSMEDTLGGSTKKVDALKEAANSFIASVAENARLTGANHRIAIAGFGLAGTYSGYQPYENTELLTGANGTVNYLNVTPADYASALLPVLNGAETNAALTSAVAAIEARGATAADLGLEMAKGIFANTDSTGRDRVVVFMTDGEPTYTNGFQKEVANNAVYNASLLKNAYDALVYSVGIFDQSESDNRKIKSFMNAVSSNYPGAKTYTNLGASASDVFSITASHTDALNGVFKTITSESLSHTVPFENVTLIKTLAPCVTLTAPQEETLRIDVIRKYGISNDQIHITRDDQGRTEIRIDGLTPYEVTDKDGNVSYEVAIEFFAALNEHASAAGDYTVDTEDSGIMLGDDALGYEATFDTNSLNLSAQKTRYIFTINGDIYEIAEGSTVAAAVPETDFAADWQFSGWNTTGVSNANGTIIDATLVKAPRTVTWHTADGDTTQVYTEGQFLNPPEVPDRADGSKFLSWDKSLPTVMLDRDLEFTAVYGPHIHRYTSTLTKKATCTEDGLLTYTCICGESYTEPVDASGHNYEAITATGDSDPTRCTFVCTNCGDRYEYALNYKVEERTGWGSRTVYEFALTDDDLNTGMQPDGSIDVRIPLNEFQSTATRVKVQRYVNGKWETVPAALEDGYLVITADHFTPYEVQFTFSCNETGEHTWNQGKETKAATCTEEGEMTYTCETCESTKTEPIGKKDHTPGAWIVDKAATCKEAGSKHQECTVCHNTIATETIAVDKTNHASYGTTLKNKVDANCTTKGYTGDAVCNGCGTVINKGNETAALGHTAPNSKGNCDRCGTHLKDVDSGSSTPAGACKYCGQVHTGPFGWLIKFFHSILALFGLHK